MAYSTFASELSDSVTQGRQDIGKSARSMTISNKKVVLIGETATGKTSVIHRFVYDEFIQAHAPTPVPTNNAKVIEGCPLVLWDTAGSEDWQQMNTSVYHGADAIVFLAAFDNEASLDRLKDHWLRILGESIDLSKCVKVLAVNKCDLDESDRQISGNAKIEETARELGVVQNGTFICSAKMNENITELFKRVALELQEPEKGKQSVDISEKKRSWWRCSLM